MTLLHLRDRFLERNIWIDAVCINQEDLSERESQIQIMSKIYGHANRVIIWLGEATDDSDRAIEEIFISAGAISTTYSLDDRRVQEPIIEEAVLALLQRPWFRRIWVREQIKYW
jgi:hypothetical protein